MGKSDSPILKQSGIPAILIFLMVIAFLTGQVSFAGNTTGITTGVKQIPVSAIRPVAPSVTQPSSPGRPVKDKWALVVGISNFQDPSIKLRYPAKDARDFANYLISEGHFAKDHVILLTDENATRANILSLIGDKWLPRVANPDDLVVIYISSHGSPADMDVGGINYLVAYDTNPDCLYATGIPLQDLMRTIKKRVHCERIVMILDACHSGAATAESKSLYRAGNVNASQVVAGTGQLVIASSKPDQVSWEGKNYDNSVFTKHLINSLKVQGAQTKLGKAYENLKDQVQQEVLMDRGQLQTPDLKSQWHGDDLVLSMVPSQPRQGIPIETLDIAPSRSPVLDIAPGKSQAAPTATQINLPPKTVLNNGNIYLVYNNPKKPTTFNVDNESLVTYIYTYHWNDGHGMPPGTIALKHSDGTVYGPWQASGKPGQGNVPNAYWECEPMIDIKPGRYTLLDSHPATWAQNEGSSGAGFARVKVVPKAPKSDAVNAQLRQGPVTKIFNNGNIYLVYNKPTRPTSFTINKPVLVTSITNYHWNDGKGQDPGNITLVHQDGTVYGPWRSKPLTGQGSAPNAYWKCEVNALLKPGLYMVLDSDADTWAHNPGSGGAGMTDIQGVYQD